MRYEVTLVVEDGDPRWEKHAEALVVAALLQAIHNGGTVHSSFVKDESGTVLLANEGSTAPDLRPVGHGLIPALLMRNPIDFPVCHHDPLGRQLLLRMRREMPTLLWWSPAD